MEDLQQSASREELDANDIGALSVLANCLRFSFSEEGRLSFPDFEIDFTPATEDAPLNRLAITICHENGYKSIHSFKFGYNRNFYERIDMTDCISVSVTPTDEKTTLEKFALEKSHLKKIMLAIADDCNGSISTQDVISSALCHFYRIRSCDGKSLSRIKRFLHALEGSVRGREMDDDLSGDEGDIVSGINVTSLCQAVSGLIEDAMRAKRGEVERNVGLLNRLLWFAYFMCGAAVAGLAWNTFKISSLHYSQLAETREALAKAESRDSNVLSSAGLADRFLDRMEIPDDMTDSGIVFYVSAPHYGLTAADTLLSNYDISRLFLDRKFLGVNVSENVPYSNRSGGIDRIRTFDFTIAGDVSGETLPKGSNNGGGSPRWADALNLLFNTFPEKDDELKHFIRWWYKSTFTYSDRAEINLDAARLEIERDSQGKITNVYYDGEGADKRIVLMKQKLLTDIPPDSLRPKIDTEEISVPLTANPNGNGKRRLFLRTGVCQNLRIPEALLKPVSELSAKLPLVFRGMSFGVNLPGEYLAADIRRYFELRDRCPKINYKKYGAGYIERTGLAHLINSKDELAKLIVNIINKDVADKGQRMRNIHDFWAENTSWSPETGDVSARPPLSITLMRAVGNKGYSGDCDILTMGEATLLAADGVETALVYADTDPAKAGSGDIYTSHLLLAVDQDAAAGLYDAATTPIWQSGGEKWVLAESQGGDYYACGPDRQESCQAGEPFGEFALGEKLGVRYIEPVAVSR